MGWFCTPYKKCDASRSGHKRAAAETCKLTQGPTAALRHAALHAHLHAPLHPSLHPPAPESEAGSTDSISSAKGRTRRGKRAGKHQKQRQSLDESRRSMDLQPAVPGQADDAVRPSRLSLDSQAAVRSLSRCLRPQRAGPRMQTWESLTSFADIP